MKKFKSVEEQLKEKGIKFETVNLDPNWYQKHLEEKRKAAEEARKKEENRIKKIKCPSCKSTSKEHVIKSDSNGIIGPGYRSWIKEEYFVCTKCGTMFKDLEKWQKTKT